MFSRPFEAYMAPVAVKVYLPDGWTTFGPESSDTVSVVVLSIRLPVGIPDRLLRSIGAIG